MGSCRFIFTGRPASFFPRRSFFTTFSAETREWPSLPTGFCCWPFWFWVVLPFLEESLKYLHLWFLLLFLPTSHFGAWRRFTRTRDFPALTLFFGFWF